MYAVFKTGGKQYRAAKGDTLKIEKLDAAEGDAVEFDQVLLVGEGSDVKVGAPLVAAAPVEEMRRAAASMRRRLLWTSIYGSCHLRPGEGGAADAFDSVMAILATPRRHFQLRTCTDSELRSRVLVQCRERDSVRTKYLPARS